MNLDVRSAYAHAATTRAAASEIIHTFRGMEPTAIAVFCAARHDGAELSATIRRAFPFAEVIGCSTSGEFTDRVYARNGVSALAIGPQKIRRCAAVIADFQAGIGTGIDRALAALGDQLDLDLREVDPAKFVGIVLIDSVQKKEERVNEALGNYAPFLSFVGGSAGDDEQWRQTFVFHNGHVSTTGAVLMLLEMAVPHTVVKTCSFVPTERVLTITRADTEHRIVYEIDRQPAAKAYADAIGASPQSLGSPHFMAHPVGLMIDGKPWLRSIVRVADDGGLFFACHIPEGMDVTVMRGTDIVTDTESAWREAERALGGPIGGGLLFNCAMRRIEVELRGVETAYHEAISHFPMAGFHTHGESWLGHINHTLTALVFR